MITNGSGAVVGTLDQLPFGEEVGTAGESEKHKFTSYERDSETGTDYAVNRQYQNATGRFMRPDPYGGSMSITDPQSFNRYTYVGNDPINSIDPLGLQQDPPLVIDVEDPPPAPQQPIESNDTLVVNTNEPGFFFFFPGFIDRPLLAFVRIDIVIGGLVDAGSDGFFTPPVPLVPEPPPAPPQSNQTDCAGFVDSLLARGSSVIAGIRMIRDAVNNVDVNGNPYDKRTTPITGFKPNLIDNGQGADVYRHVLFVTGTVLLGETGALLRGAFIGYDAYQANVKGRKESETELRDDLAGLSVGGTLVNGTLLGATNNLGGKLRSILCDK